ncbi:hypothetical protein JHK82_029709 [Glycine max]|nr:hypothetical protein JHK82_029709 [Glycine max]
MGEALFDLEQVLMSKKEILTPQEADILLSCKSKSLRDFTAGALAAGTAAWAGLMVTKYQSDPSLMQLISKHFYSERIFDDSTSNNPKLRWRYRNFFSDNAVHGHRTHDRESNDKSQEHSHNDSNDKSLGWSENVTHSKRTNLETKRTFENADIMSEGDPLDCLFSYAPPVEDIHHSNSPNKPSGIHNRARRRSHRRRRMRNHDDLSNSESAAAI